MRHSPLIVFCCAFLAFAPSTAFSNPVAVFIAEWILGRVLDDIWDAATGEPDIRELDRRLHEVELILGQECEEVRREISELRAAITRNEIALKDVHIRLAAIQDRLREVESHLKLHDQELENIRQTIEALENLFRGLEQRVGRLEVTLIDLPPASFSFLLVEARQGQLVPHPHVVEWAQLLASSVQARTELDRLGQFFTNASPEYLTAAKNAQKVAAKVEAFHQIVTTEFAQTLSERENLLRIYTPIHEKVSAIDDSMAPLYWLSAVSVPLAEGTGKGHLAIPRALFDRPCSEMIIAFQDAHQDTAILFPLFRAMLAASSNESPPPFAGATELPPGMGIWAERASEASRKLVDLHNTSQETLRILKNLRKTLTDRDPSVKAQLTNRQSQIARLCQIRRESDSLLTSALSAYVSRLEFERPTSPGMRQFWYWVLLRIWSIHGQALIDDADSDRMKLRAWESFAASRELSGILVPPPSPISPPTKLSIQEKSPAQRQIPAHKGNAHNVVRVTLAEDDFYRAGSSRIELKDADDHEIELDIDGEEVELGIGIPLIYSGPRGEEITVICVSSDDDHDTAWFQFEW